MDDEDLEAGFARLGTELAEALAEALGRWVERRIRSRVDEWVAAGGMVPPPDELVAAVAAARAATEEREVPALRRLLGADVDDQTTSPLHVVRGAVDHATVALEHLGVGEVQRDVHAEAIFPDDRFDLTPGSMADVSPDLTELAMAWGAAKAMVHRRRHEGRT